MLNKAGEVAVTKSSQVGLTNNLLCFYIVRTISLLVDAAFQKSSSGEKA